MFKCAACKEVSAPRVSPVKLVIGTRPVSYHNEFYREDEWGNKELHKVDSTGTEIVGEVLVCPKCVNQQPAIQSALTIIGARSYQEKLAEPMHVKMFAAVLEAARTRFTHQTKRGQQDVAIAVPLIKYFADENKGLVV